MLRGKAGKAVGLINIIGSIDQILPVALGLSSGILTAQHSLTSFLWRLFSHTGRFCATRSCVYEQLPSKHLQHKAEARVLNLPPRAFRRRRHPRRLRYPRQHGIHYLSIGAAAPSTPRISASVPRFRIDMKHVVVTAQLVRHLFQHYRHPRHHRHHRHPRHHRRPPTRAFRIVRILDFLYPDEIDLSPRSPPTSENHLYFSVV